MDRYIATALERLLARCPLHRAGNGRRAAHATATQGGDVGLLASGPGIGDARSVTRVRAAIALVLVGGVLAAVPGSADARSPSRSYLKGPFTTATVNRFTGDLARAGVGVYEPGATRPVRRVRGRPSPLRVSATQLRSLAAGAWARTGLSGKSLNAVSGSVRLSRRLKMSAAVLVAGWAKRAHTPKARLARRIMGRVDWRRYRQLVFPNAVLVLQAADTASHLRDAGLARGRAAALAGAAAAPLLAPFQAAPVGPCTATLNFVRGTVNKFFDVLGEALSAKTLKRLLGNNWFSDVVSGVVELLVFKPVRAVLEGARKVVLAAIELPIKVVTTAISGISSAVGVAGTVANALTPWTGKVTAAPDPVTLGTKPQEGLFDLRVTAPGGEFQWPDWMTDCAQVVGLTLPTLTPKGAKVTWDVGSQTPAGVISRVLDSGPLSDLGAASLTWVTATETPEQAKGHLRVGGVLAVARVQRDDLDKLVKLVHDRILGLLPDIVVKYFGPTIRRVTEPLIERLAEGIETLRTVEANTLLRVRYHVAKDKDKKPGGPGGRPPASCAVSTERKRLPGRSRRVHRRRPARSDPRLRPRAAPARPGQADPEHQWPARGHHLRQLPHRQRPAPRRVSGRQGLHRQRRARTVEGRRARLRGFPGDGGRADGLPGVRPQLGREPLLRRTRGLHPVREELWAEHVALPDLQRR